MKKDKDYWSSIYYEFCRSYPDLAEDIVDWYPSAQNEIVLKLRGDVRYSFDLYCNLHKIYDRTETDDISDDEWKKSFSKKLNEKLCVMNMTQEELAHRTGISQVTISKYIRGLSIPSCTNMRRIARALKSNTSEFMYD